MTPPEETRNVSVTLTDPAAVDLSSHGVIEASAGTGKTYTIALLALRALAGGMDEPGIAVVARDLLITTFTRNAAGELRDRIRLFLALAVNIVKSNRQPDTCLDKADSESRPVAQVLLDCLADQEDASGLQKRLLRAQADFAEATVTTLHGFCQTILRDQRLLTGADLELEINAQDAWQKRLARDIWRRQSERSEGLIPSLSALEMQVEFLCSYDPLREKIVWGEGEMDALGEKGEPGNYRQIQNQVRDLVTNNFDLLAQ